MKIGFLRLMIISFSIAGSEYSVTTQASSLTNPINWQVSRNFNSPVAVGDSDTITYTIQNLLPWSTVHPVIIKAHGNPNNEFSIVDNCSGQVLGPINQTNSNCLVTVTLAPLVAGDKSFQLGIAGYSNNELYLPSLSTQSFTPVIQDTSSDTGGRLIGYLEGWNLPPTAASIKNAGYTHVLIAFGVFSTTNPGQIVTDLSGIPDPQAYIQSLQALGIKVLLSIGGASTNLPNTTTNFNQVLSAASSQQTFITTFEASLNTLATTYGFDGFDFDIEQGFIPAGTFTNPTGDIAALASIINDYKNAHSTQLISLVPQIANISATSGFNDTFGNYSSLIMQTHASLSWVAIQLYNAGCAFGIDCVCHDPNTLTTTPDSAVAFAVDLLANWPSSCPEGQASGFQPYIANLTGNQVVLGYPVNNQSGISDGSPAAVLSVVKRAVTCLRTGVQSSTSCDTYVPPTPYPQIGGVFSWNIGNDANNNYNFATGIYSCVISGVC